jgi:hypothetical protein
MAAVYVASIWLRHRSLILRHEGKLGTFDLR